MSTIQEVADQYKSANLYLVGGFENLNDVGDGDVHLEILFTKRLKPVVGESVKIRRGKQVKRIFRGHRHVSPIDVTKKRVKGLRGWDKG